MKFLVQLNARVGSLGALLSSPLLLLLRAWWGWSFCRTGFGKLTHLSQTSEFFASLSIPAPYLNAIAAGSVEMICGALLALGFFSRLAALPLLATMAVAYLTAEREALTAIFSDPDKFTSATPFLFSVVVLLVLVFGPGAWSVDGILGRERATRKG
ncbi:DoxX family protein [Nibricoccus sp. IMCC34717]|uniref:DoxX family protein n=1 Tax=Nibricoccus sp. IMCC34717 TaxID=3034021 RepID=UPI00384D590C